MLTLEATRFPVIYYRTFPCHSLEFVVLLLFGRGRCKLSCGSLQRLGAKTHFIHVFIVYIEQNMLKEDSRLAAWLYCTLLFLHLRAHRFSPWFSQLFIRNILSSITPFLSECWLKLLHYCSHIINVVWCVPEHHRKWFWWSDLDESQRVLNAFTPSG